MGACLRLVEVWKMMGSRDIILSHSLLQTWKEFWPETRKEKKKRRCGGEMFTEPQGFSENWPMSCPALVTLRLLHTQSANTTMCHWHGWYEGNCAFCSNPGHMQRIKYSSSQNLQRVNELLIRVLSSHIHCLHLPLQMGWWALYLTLRYKNKYTSLSNAIVFISLYSWLQ